MTQLWQCLNAKVYPFGTKGEPIYKILCAKGHPLSLSSDGSIELIRAKRGEPLKLQACQDCLDYICMGEPLPGRERGWLKYVED